MGGSGTNVIYAKDGLGIGLGKIYLDILNPIGLYDHDFNEKNSNNSSIVFVLEYLNFKALMTGDIEIEGINRLVREKKIPEVEYIKIPHHGSKNNITSSLLKFSNPKVAVISVGKNSYGHPNKEVLDLLGKYKIPYFRTDENKNVVLIFDKRKGNFRILE